MHHAPGFWRDEISGALRVAVEKYLNGLPLDSAEVDIMRAYCRQWVNATVWEENPHGTEELDELRRLVDTITDKATLSDWLELAIDAGISAFCRE